MPLPDFMATSELRHRELSVDIEMCESRGIRRWYKTALMICTFLSVTSEQLHNHYTTAGPRRVVYNHYTTAGQQWVVTNWYDMTSVKNQSQHALLITSCETLRVTKPSLHSVSLAQHTRWSQGHCQGLNFGVPKAVMLGQIGQINSSKIMQVQIHTLKILGVLSTTWNHPVGAHGWPV